MTDCPIENELEAIKTVTNALQPLDDSARTRVLRYVTQHLGIAWGGLDQDSKPANRNDEVNSGGRVDSETPSKKSINDIRTFKEKKQPSSDSQMAAVVAYYLAELAPERKSEITTSDINTFFKQAGFPLPRRPEFTLPNAKQAGYLDSLGSGKYKLNPVGHNLVVHNLPKQDPQKSVGGRQSMGRHRRTPKRSPTKRASKKAV